MYKKIFLNGRFLTRPITGVQRTAFEMVKALDNLIEQNVIDRHTHLFTLIYAGTIINPIELKHIKLLRKGIFEGNIWEQLELPFYTAGSLLVSMCTISTLLKKKQIVIVHDASFLVNPGFFSVGFRVWYKFAIPFLSRMVRQIVTVSNFSKSELIKHGGFKAEKISVIYNAADHILRFENPEAVFIEKINSVKPYCLAVSSLGANKNFVGLSTAIQKIDFSKYNMVIAGGAIGALKHSSPDASIAYLGYVTNAELKYLYSNAALFIFPSFYEGFGIPPLEAMILGCPVIASNTSSIPEVLGDACTYFNPANIDDMAEKIYALINDNVRLKELKYKGYERAERYSWQKSALQLYQLTEQYSD